MTSASARLGGVSALALVVSSFAQSASADENHYQNYLIGERAVGLGGAYTAISDDLSGAFYNPAGIAEAPYGSLAMTASVYGFIDREVTVLPVSDPSDERGFVAYPATAGWIWKLADGAPDGGGRLQLAISVLTPTSNSLRRGLAFDGDAGVYLPGLEFENVEFTRIIADDDSLWGGASISYKPNARWSVGATVFATVRMGLYQFYEITSTAVGPEDDLDVFEELATPARTELNFTNVGLLAVLGATYRATEELRFGVALMTPQIDFIKDGNFDFFGVTLNPGDPLFVEAFDGKARYNGQRPFRASLGVAYLLARTFGVSADFAFYTPVSRRNLIEVDVGADVIGIFETEHKATWQLNLGTEFYPVESLALRAGFFTNRSSYVECDPSRPACLGGVNPFIDVADRYGVSGSVSYELERATLTFAGTYNFGSTELETQDGLLLEESSSYLFFTIGVSFRFID